MAILGSFLARFATIASILTALKGGHNLIAILASFTVVLYDELVDKLQTLRQNLPKKIGTTKDWSILIMLETTRFSSQATFYLYFVHTF